MLGMKVLRKSIEPLRAEPDDSLGELYVRYAHWLKARVSRQYGCEDAEDLVQEAWLRLTPSGVASVVRHPKALLLKIVSNVAIDRAKRRKLAHAAECEMARHMFWGGQPEAQSNQIVLSQTILGLPQPLRDVALVIDCYLALSAGRRVRSAAQCRSPGMLP